MAPTERDWEESRKGPVIEKWMTYMKTLLETGADEEVAFDLQNRIQDTGALTEGRKRLVQQTWRARKALSTLKPSPDRDALDHLAASIAK